MKYLTVLSIAAMFGVLSACKSMTPEEQVAEEKMTLSKAYQDCTAKAKAYKEAQAAGKQDEIDKDDRMTDEDCETIRKNLEALN